MAFPPASNTPIEKPWKHIKATAINNADAQGNTSVAIPVRSNEAPRTNILSTRSYTKPPISDPPI